MPKVTLELECELCEFRTKEYGTKWRDHLFEEEHQKLTREKNRTLKDADKKRSCVVLGIRGLKRRDVLNFFSEKDVVTEFIFWAECPDICLVEFLLPKATEDVVKGTKAILQNEVVVRPRNKISDVEWRCLCPLAAVSVKTENQVEVVECMQSSSVESLPLADDCTDSVPNSTVTLKKKQLSVSRNIRDQKGERSGHSKTHQTPFDLNADASTVSSYSPNKPTSSDMNEESRETPPTKTTNTDEAVVLVSSHASVHERLEATANANSQTPSVNIEKNTELSKSSQRKRRPSPLPAEPQGKSGNLNSTAPARKKACQKLVQGEVQKKRFVNVCGICFVVEEGEFSLNSGPSSFTTDSNSSGVSLPEEPEPKSGSSNSVPAARKKKTCNKLGRKQHRSVKQAAVAVKLSDHNKVHCLSLAASTQMLLHLSRTTYGDDGRFLSFFWAEIIQGWNLLMWENLFGFKLYEFAANDIRQLGQLNMKRGYEKHGPVIKGILTSLDKLPDWILQLEPSDKEAKIVEYQRLCFESLKKGLSKKPLRLFDKKAESLCKRRSAFGSFELQVNYVDELEYNPSDPVSCDLHFQNITCSRGFTFDTFKMILRVYEWLVKEGGEFLLT